MTETYTDLYAQAVALEERGATTEAAKLYERAEELRTETVETFLATCSEALHDKAEGFTCTEADSITALLSAWVDDDAARAFADAHCLGDEPGDAHYPDRVLFEGVDHQGPIALCADCNGILGAGGNDRGDGREPWWHANTAEGADCADRRGDSPIRPVCVDCQHRDVTPDRTDGRCSECAAAIAVADGLAVARGE